MKERVLLFDIMKALCVIEIVAFWHMLDYTPLIYTKVPWGEQLTFTGLSAFTFASGFFLGKKQISAIPFYKSRLKRFMIPLLGSLLIFYFLHLTSLKAVCLAPIGLSCFIGPMPLTLWYFSMIILFYWVTPLLLWRVWSMSPLERTMNVVVRSIMIYLIMVLANVEERVQMYFFFYILGIIVNLNVIKIVVNIKPIYQMGGANHLVSNKLQKSLFIHI
ncbi:acyltransferase family protein [Bacteroides gallinaceum]|uniref:acyltransferase family protein n=1 Tax=Bacteroides gallinaceum TaxID=1462571 RepID=UPI0025AA32E9|nr:acyltransferase family protein [Bacteroides gallinaceum]MDN0066640.1 acyltransferase family protein [Bacteroides gallinaceum]